MTLPSIRDAIARLESEMLTQEQLEIKTEHTFCGGIYARTIYIPKGALVTGKIHKTDHLNIVSKGKIAVWTDDGMRIVEAPCTITAKAGIKRVGLALEDTVWTTLHATQETDLQKIEHEFIATSYEELSYGEQLKLEV